MPVIRQSRRASASAPVLQAGAEPWLCDWGSWAAPARPSRRLGLMPNRAASSRMMPPPIPPPIMGPRPIPRRSWTCDGSSGALSLKLMQSQYPRTGGRGRPATVKLVRCHFSTDSSAGPMTVPTTLPSSWPESASAGPTCGTRRRPWCRPAPAITVLSEHNSTRFAVAVRGRSCGRAPVRRAGSGLAAGSCRTGSRPASPASRRRRAGAGRISRRDGLGRT